jgi:hypothetical protein
VPVMAGRAGSGARVFVIAQGRPPATGGVCPAGR